ncbi:BnaCnng34270D [Brassica napus]|uniref:BnaCnng34270D protein n=1 Tax=Brassica napus TaxID=3708 RepID=A0A078J128_BRANA|nr:BnaCnng34270D [Brassica napus]
MASTPPQTSKKVRNNSGSGQTVKFARRTSSGRYVSLSRDNIELSGELSGDYSNYTVHIPPTPDNQPMATKAEEQYVSNSLFTGGFNSVTRAHLMDKVIDSDVTHPQMAGAKGSSCAMPACDGNVMKDERGKDVMPCECRFKICRDCFMDAQKETGLCPGCKEQYRIGDLDDDTPDFSSGALPLPAPGKGQRGNNNMSMMKRNQNGEFDHNRWLFETQGTYGYGNAYWPQDEMYGDDMDEEMRGGMVETADKPWRPLSRRIPIPAAIISPYRLLIVVRFVVLCFFLTWRIRNPNEDAVWLWLMSIIWRSDLPGIDLFKNVLKVIAGIEISFTLTSKSGGDDIDDIYADLYIVKWSSLMIPPIVIAMVNIIAIVVAFVRTIYQAVPQWSKLIGGAFFSFWVLAHLYPFAKGLMGRRGKTPTIVFVWAGLIAITISLLWTAINPNTGPAAAAEGVGGGGFQFP